MQAIKDFLLLAVNEQLSVPTWEILALLTIVAVCLLLRAARVGIFITYIFTLHLAWNFMKLHFAFPSLVTFAALAGIVLIIGFFSVITER